MSDQRIRSLAREACLGDQHAQQRLVRELRRHGLGPNAEPYDPALARIVEEIQDGPVVKVGREVSPSTKDRLRGDADYLYAEVGSTRIVIGLADDVGRYNQCVAAAWVRSCRARRSAATRKRQRLEQGYRRPKPAPYRRVTRRDQEALWLLEVAASRSSGVLSAPAAAIQALMGLEHEADALRLLKALSQDRIPAAKLFASSHDDEWVVVVIR